MAKNETFDYFMSFNLNSWFLINLKKKKKLDKGKLDQEFKKHICGNELKGPTGFTGLFNKIDQFS